MLLNFSFKTGLIYRISGKCTKIGVKSKRIKLIVIKRFDRQEGGFENGTVSRLSR